MADGSFKKIKDVQVGAWVLSRDLRTGAVTPVRVLHVTTSYADAKVTLTLPNGEKMGTTFNHLFYSSNKGFVSAGAMASGFECAVASGDSISISKVSASTKRRQVYNLVVDGNHTFLVGKAKMVVHDITPLW